GLERQRGLRALLEPAVADVTLRRLCCRELRLGGPQKAPRSRRGWARALGYGASGGPGGTRVGNPGGLAAPPRGTSPRTSTWAWTCCTRTCRAERHRMDC